VNRVLPGPADHDPVLSIVVPVYYNEQTLEPLYQCVVSTFEQILSPDNLEIVFVDDGSGDRSFDVLGALAKKDPGRVRVLRLARNFGSHAAILAGLGACRGRYAAMLSADLQDPPEIIVRMLEQARMDGAYVVLAVRDAREEPALKTHLANGYYWIMRTLSDAKFPSGGFDCFLIHRHVIDALTRLNETNTSLTAQILWLGFRRSSISYIRKARTHGKSRWTLRKKVGLLVDSLVSFSRLPIRLVEAMGLGAMMCGLAYATFITILRLTSDKIPPGWASLMVVLLVMSGLTLISLGIIGEYLWRILNASRRRPAFLVAESLNFEINSGSEDSSEEPQEGLR
jgi:dolichol-phosphate mannosyltransferase